MVVDTLSLHPPLDELTDYCRRNQLVELSLFGSALRDDLNPESDLDLLVTFAPDTKIGLMVPGRIE